LRIRSGQLQPDAFELVFELDFGAIDGSAPSLSRQQSMALCKPPFGRGKR
jgi:hypothetical protein